MIFRRISDQVKLLKIPEVFLVNIRFAASEAKSNYAEFNQKSFHGIHSHSIIFFVVHGHKDLVLDSNIQCTMPDWKAIFPMTILQIEIKEDMKRRLAIAHS